MILLSSLISQPGKANPTGVVLPEKPVKKWVLENGLTLMVLEDRSAPVASVQIWCRTGSIDEDKWLGAGLSHILEHMLFKGTESRNTSQIAPVIQDAGGYINAYTSFDRTVYWVDIPKEGVPVALEVLSDAVMNSTLPEEEYVKEQEVIRREFAMGNDDPARVGSKLLFETAYSVHPFRVPVIGWIDVYNQLTRDDVMEYYKARYVPNNLTVIVVGDVDAAAVHRQVADFFSAYPRQALAPVYIPEEPKQLGRRELHEEFPTELTHLSMAWHIPSLTHPDVPALDVLGAVLGNGNSSRLYRDLREKEGIVYSISAGAFTPASKGLFFVSAKLDPQNREAVTQGVIERIRAIAENGVTDAELQKARNLMLASQIEGMETMRGLASDIGSNWFYTQNIDFTREFLEAVNAVTSSDLQRVAKAYFEEQNLTITSLNPVGSITSSSTETAAAEELKIESFQLSNGMTVLVREDKRLPIVAVNAVFKGGTLVETPENSGLTKVFSRAWLKGTTTRSADEIAETIESLGGDISTESGNNSFSISMSLMSPTWKTGFEIFNDVLQNPTFPEEAVTREKQAQIAAIKAEEDQMTAVARNLLREKLFQDHPYSLRSSGSVASVENITRADVEAFYKTHVAAKNGVIAVFGDVTKEAVRETLEAALATLPAGQPAHQDIPQPPFVESTQTFVENRDKSQAVIMVGYRGIDLANPDRVPLELIDEASSDLGSRFFVRIREEMGLAYFVGSSQLVGVSPGLFAFYVGTDPLKVDEVSKVLNEEIANLAENGLTEAELARAKKKMIGRQQIANQSNSAFAYSAALNELFGLGADYFERLPAEVEAVTLEQVKEVANKYFKNQQSITALVKPEKAAPAAAETELPETP